MKNLIYTIIVLLSFTLVGCASTSNNDKVLTGAYQGSSIIEGDLNTVKQEAKNIKDLNQNKDPGITAHTVTIDQATTAALAKLPAINKGLDEVKPLENKVDTLTTENKKLSSQFWSPVQIAWFHITVLTISGIVVLLIILDIIRSTPVSPIQAIASVVFNIVMGIVTAGGSFIVTGIGYFNDWVGLRLASLFKGSPKPAVTIVTPTVSSNTAYTVSNPPSNTYTPQANNPITVASLSTNSSSSSSSSSVATPVAAPTPLPNTIGPVISG